MRFKPLLQKFTALFFVSAFIVLPSFSQLSSDWYYGKPIKAVTFENLYNVRQSDLEGITAGYIGKNFSDAVFADLLNRIFATDYFDDINPQALPGDSKYSSVKLNLVMTERPVVSEIIFTGNHKMREFDLKGEIETKEDEIFVESKALVDERHLRDFYIEKGYTNASVSSKFEKIDGNIRVTFTISEGQQTVVKAILFQGNQVVSDKTLKSKLSMKESGKIIKGEFQESRLEADRKTLASYYHDRGYVDAKVLDVLRSKEYNPDKDRDEITITFILQEGSQYNFGGITFEGNKVFSSQELENLVKLKKDALFNQSKFEESIMAVEDLYFENGYTGNQFVSEVDKNTETKVISYVLKISESSRSHIENIIIKGNTKTKDYIIKREIPLESGDIFSKAKIMNGLRNLYNLQYFSAVVPEILAGSEEGLVDLVFSVEEQSTTTLDFGFTFSGVSDPDEFPIALYAKIQDSNLFGEGRNVSASVTLSTDEQSADITYGQNWLFGLPVSASVSLGYSHSNNYALRNKLLPDGIVSSSAYYMEYEQHSFNLTGSLGRRWAFDFAILTVTGGVTGSLIDNIFDSSVYIPLDSTVSTYNNNWSPKNSFFSQFSLDGRNIAYDASKGWFVSERLAWYGLIPAGILPFAPQWGETEFYLRTDTKVEKYFTLLDLPVSESYNFKIILMAYSGLSLQLPAFNSVIKDVNKMYIDGMFNGRGWYVYNDVSRRGSALWSNILEIRFPVVPNVLSFDLFFDGIYVSNKAADFFTNFGNEDNWYFSFGPSIRFAIQQFPLRLLFCNTFHFKDGQIEFVDKYCEDPVKWWKNWNFVLSFNLANK